MSSTEWLNMRAPWLSNLPPIEREAMINFSLIWSLFEAHVFCRDANSTKILALAEQLNDQGRLVAEDFEEELRYFQNRYVANGEFTDNFSTLYLERVRNVEHRYIVERVLKNENTTLYHIVAALLIIVYRLRNNLFHGEKWIDGICGQFANFNHANSLLMRVYDLRT